MECTHLFTQSPPPAPPRSQPGTVAAAAPSTVVSVALQEIDNAPAESATISPNISDSASNGLEHLPLSYRQFEEVVQAASDQWGVIAQELAPQALVDARAWPQGISLRIEGGTFSARYTASEIPVFHGSVVHPQACSTDIVLMRLPDQNYAPVVEGVAQIAPPYIPQDARFHWAAAQGLIMAMRSASPYATAPRASICTIRTMIAQSLREAPETVAEYVGAPLSECRRQLLKLAPKIEQAWGTSPIERTADHIDRPHTEMESAHFQPLARAIQYREGHRVAWQALDRDDHAGPPLPDLVREKIAEYAPLVDVVINEVESIPDVINYLRANLSDGGASLTQRHWNIITRNFNNLTNRIILEYGITGRDLFRFCHALHETDRIFSRAAGDALSSSDSSSDEDDGAAQAGMREAAQDDVNSLLHLHRNLYSRKYYLDDESASRSEYRILRRNFATADLIRSSVRHDPILERRVELLLDSQLYKRYFDNLLPEDQALGWLSDPTITDNRLRQIIRATWHQEEVWGELSTWEYASVDWMNRLQDSVVDHIIDRSDDLIMVNRHLGFDNGPSLARISDAIHNLLGEYSQDQIPLMLDQARIDAILRLPRARAIDAWFKPIAPPLHGMKRVAPTDATVAEIGTRTEQHSLQPVLHRPKMARSTQSNTDLRLIDHATAAQMGGGALPGGWNVAESRLATLFYAGDLQLANRHLASFEFPHGHPEHTPLALVEHLETWGIAPLWIEQYRRHSSG